MESPDAGWFARTFQVWAEMFDPQEPQPRFVSVFADGEPVVPMEGMVVVGSRAGLDQVLLNPSIYTAQGLIEIGNTRPLIPISIDPPMPHASYRRLLEPLFAPSRMDAHEAQIACQMNVEIDRVIEKGRCDFVAEVANRFPSSVFLGLLGMPLEDLDYLNAMKNGSMHPAPESGRPEDARRIQDAAGKQIYEYFDAALTERARRPRDDMLTAFLGLELDGEKLNRTDLLDICFNLLIAGLDTVSGALSCCMAFLAQSPDHQGQIAADPWIIPDAVEELLRWETPVNGIFRRAAVDTELLGCPVKAGQLVNVASGAANLDPVEFPSPFEIDFSRRPNRHLAFGKGIHRCLGSHLARRQLRIGIREWHARIPKYELDGDQVLEYLVPTRMIRSLKLRWA